MFSTEICAWSGTDPLNIHNPGDEISLRHTWHTKTPTSTLPTTPYFPHRPSTPPDDELTTHLHALPQELYDIILSLTFTPPRHTTIPLDAAYTLPSILQVSRQTRAAVLKVYYLENVFEPLDARDVWGFSNVVPRSVREGVRRGLEERWCRGRWPPDMAFGFAWDFA